MSLSDKSPNLRIELDAKNCEISNGEIEKIESGLAPLRDPVEHFPVADLHITVIFHPRSRDYHVKTSLVLTGTTLFTGDRDMHMYTAFERCVRKLVKKVEHYKHRMANSAELAKHEKGTYHAVAPSQEPQTELLEQAVSTGDYAAFRTSTYVYEEAIRNRVGRWIQRYPEVNAQLAGDSAIGDIVEEVFLNAFEQYPRRPQSVRLGDWLEDLIDPSIRLLLKNPDQELENISFARTLRNAPPDEG